MDNRAGNSPLTFDYDTYQGMSWSDRLQFGPLGYALDPNDKTGRKNLYIDTVHRIGIRRALGARRYRRALDFGCGCGRLLDELHVCAEEVYGIDRTAPALDVAQESHVGANLTLWRSGSMPYPDGFFDLIISVYVLLTTEMLAASIKELRRVSSVDATLILLEQVNDARGLTIEHYTAALKDGGFDVECASPIRRAQRSKYLRLASLFRWPTLILQLLARAEARSLIGGGTTRDEQSYYDYLITCRTTPATM